MTRDPVVQILNVRFRYERWRDGRVIGNEHASFRMRWFWRYELEHLLARAGFDEVEIHGDFDWRADQREHARLRRRRARFLAAHPHDDVAEDRSTADAEKRADRPRARVRGSSHR